MPTAIAERSESAAVAELNNTPPNDQMLALIDQQLDARLDQLLDEKLAAREARANEIPRLAIIASKGTLDMAYPPFILASTAAALGWEVEIFFTFYGLALLKKELDLGVTPVGNPAMPMKLPYGPDWLRRAELKIPSMLSSNLPGFEGMATGMMKKTLRDKGVASIEELREICLEADVKMLACQMTVDLYGWQQSDFVDEVAEWLGATSFLPQAAKADVCLFI